MFLPEVRTASPEVRTAALSELYTTRQGLAQGLTPGQLRRAPTIGGLTGVRQRSSVGEVDGHQRQDDQHLKRDPRPRVLASGLVLPAGCAIGGWAAGVVHGIPPLWIDGRGADLRDLPVPFQVGGAAGRRARRGTRPQASVLPADDMTQVDGLPVTTGVRTAFDLVRFARNDQLAMAAGDAAVRYGLTSADELAEFANAHRCWRGLPRLRRVVGLLSPYAESPRESELRLLWISSGLPPPLVNPCLHDRSGRFVGRCDLMDKESGQVGEYNGQWHRQGEQQWADVRRERGFTRLNCTVTMVGSPDFANHARAAIDALLDDRGRALGRDRSRDGWVVRPQTGHPRLM